MLSFTAQYNSQVELSIRIQEQNNENKEHQQIQALRNQPIKLHRSIIYLLLPR